VYTGIHLHRPTSQLGFIYPLAELNTRRIFSRLHRRASEAWITAVIVGLCKPLLAYTAGYRPIVSADGKVSLLMTELSAVTRINM